MFPDSMRALSSTKVRAPCLVCGKIPGDSIGDPNAQEGEGDRLSPRVGGVEGPGIELGGREISVVSDLTSSSETLHSVCLPDEISSTS